MIKEEGKNKEITELRVNKLQKLFTIKSRLLKVINVDLLFQSSLTDTKMAQTMEWDGTANLQNWLLQNEKMGSMAGLDCQ